MWLYKIIWCLVRLPWRLLFPVRIIGKRNLPKQGGVVLVSSHRGLADPLHAGFGLSRKLHFLGKHEIFKKAGIFAGVLRYLGGIPLDRANPGISTIKTCVSVLKEGKVLLLYPEGTRNRTADPLLPLKSGMSLFALMAKVPVVPMYQMSRARLLRRNYLVVGSPMDFSAYYGKKPDEALLGELDEAVRSRMLELKALIPEKFAAKERVRLEAEAAAYIKKKSA